MIRTGYFTGNRAVEPDLPFVADRRVGLVDSSEIRAATENKLGMSDTHIACPYSLIHSHKAQPGLIAEAPIGLIKNANTNMWIAEHLDLKNVSQAHSGTSDRSSCGGNRSPTGS